MKRRLSQDEENDEIPNRGLLEASSALSALRKKIHWKQELSDEQIEYVVE